METPKTNLKWKGSLDLGHTVQAVVKSDLKPPDVFMTASDGKTISAHKCILSVSPVLKTLLSCMDVRLSGEARLLFPDFSTESIQSVVDFVYNGYVEMPRQKKKEFTKLCKMLRLDPPIILNPRSDIASSADKRRDDASQIATHSSTQNHKSSRALNNNLQNRNFHTKELVGQANVPLVKGSDENEAKGRLSSDATISNVVECKVEVIEADESKTDLLRPCDIKEEQIQHCSPDIDNQMSVSEAAHVPITKGSCPEKENGVLVLGGPSSKPQESASPGAAQSPSGKEVIGPGKAESHAAIGSKGDAAPQEIELANKRQDYEPASVPDLKCDICLRSFSAPDSLASHKRNDHLVDQISDDDIDDLLTDDAPLDRSKYKTFDDRSAAETISTCADPSTDPTSGLSLGLEVDAQSSKSDEKEEVSDCETPELISVYLDQLNQKYKSTEGSSTMESLKPQSESVSPSIHTDDDSATSPFTADTEASEMMTSHPVEATDIPDVEDSMEMELSADFHTSMDNSDPFVAVESGFKMPENFDIPQDYIQEIVPQRKIADEPVAKLLKISEDPTDRAEPYPSQINLLPKQPDYPPKEVGKSQPAAVTNARPSVEQVNYYSASKNLSKSLKNSSANKSSATDKSATGYRKRDRRIPDNWAKLFGESEGEMDAEEKPARKIEKPRDFTTFSSASILPNMEEEPTSSVVKQTVDQASNFTNELKEKKERLMKKLQESDSEIEEEKVKTKKRKKSKSDKKEVARKPATVTSSTKDQKDKSRQKAPFKFEDDLGWIVPDSYEDSPLSDQETSKEKKRKRKKKQKHKNREGDESGRMDEDSSEEKDEDYRRKRLLERKEKKGGDVLSWMFRRPKISVKFYSEGKTQILDKAMYKMRLLADEDTSSESAPELSAHKQQTKRVKSDTEDDKHIPNINLKRKSSSPHRDKRKGKKAKKRDKTRERMSSDEDDWRASTQLLEDVSSDEEVASYSELGSVHDYQSSSGGKDVKHQSGSLKSAGPPRLLQRSHSLSGEATESSSHGHRPGLDRSLSLHLTGSIVAGPSHHNSQQHLPSSFKIPKLKSKQDPCPREDK